MQGCNEQIVERVISMLGEVKISKAQKDEIKRIRMKEVASILLMETPQKFEPGSQEEKLFIRIMTEPFAKSLADDTKRIRALALVVRLHFLPTREIKSTIDALYLTALGF